MTASVHSDFLKYTGLNATLAVERIVVDEEHHIDWIEAQRHKIAEVGYQQYLRSRSTLDAAGRDAGSIPDEPGRRTVVPLTLPDVDPAE